VHGWRESSASILLFLYVFYTCVNCLAATYDLGDEFMSIGCLRKYYTITCKVLPLLAIILAVAGMPILYYRWMRWVIFIVTFLGYWVEFRRYTKYGEYDLTILVMIGAALIFNPFKPFYYAKARWVIIDYLFIAAFALLIITDILAEKIRDEESYQIAKQKFDIVNIFVIIGLVFFTI
jgi:hypothetical protein